MADRPKRLTADQCREKAAECEVLASTAKRADHQLMFLHMAETWEQIARDVEKYKLDK